MKKSQSKNLISLMALLAMLCIGYATLSFAAPSHGVRYTKHNFSTSKLTEFPDFKASTETQICIFCHTPHNSFASKGFLWNRVDSTATFQMYTSSRTLDFTNKPAAPSAISKMCMSCHDGGTAINAMANPINQVVMAGGATGDEIGDIYDFIQLGMAWGPNIGEGTSATNDITPGGILLNDHPISFVYEQSCTKDSTIKKESGACNQPTIGGLPLWWSDDNTFSGYKVECPTCHDPHINYNQNNGGDAAYTPFLRKTVSSSSLCFTCHNK